MENVKTTATTYTPNQCTEISGTSFTAIKIGALYYVQTQGVKEGKIISCVQPTTYASAALAKTAINLLTAAYIDTL